MCWHKIGILYLFIVEGYLYRKWCEISDGGDCEVYRRFGGVYSLHHQGDFGLMMSSSSIRCYWTSNRLQCQRVRRSFRHMWKTLIMPDLWRSTGCCTWLDGSITQSGCGTCFLRTPDNGEFPPTGRDCAENLPGAALGATIRRALIFRPTRRLSFTRCHWNVFLVRLATRVSLK